MWLVRSTCCAEEVLGPSSLEKTLGTSALLFLPVQKAHLLWDLVFC